MQRIRDRLSKYFRFDIYGRLLPYVWPHKLAMVVVIGMTLVYSGLNLLDPWPMALLVDSALGGKPMPDQLRQAVPFLSLDSGYAIAVFAVVGGLVLWLARHVLDIIQDYIKGRVNDGMRFHFGLDFFNHLLRLSFKYHDRTTVGDSIYRLNNDTSFISTLVWSNFRHLLTATVTFAGMLWIVVQLDWVIAVLALSIAPLQYASIIMYNKLFKERSKRIRAMESLGQTLVQEILSCLRVVKAFGQEQREHRKLGDLGWKTMRTRQRLDFQQSWFSTGVGFVSKLDGALILLVGSFRVLQGQITLGELMVILAYVGQIQEPLQLIGDVLHNMQSSLISAERIMEVLDVDPDIQDRPGAKVLDRVQGAIAFEDVCFGYDPERLVLHHVSLSARPGEVIALVGPTGAGKTTLGNLIVRFYDPDSGRVTFDGHDLRDLTVRTLREHIALVLQEPILFSASIGDNIAYGRPDASLAEIEAAAQAAGAHDFIAALPEAYESQVGERGVRLSGGERQRICIARAFLKDAPVLILDEPTSSVDSRTELAILDALDRLMVGRTTFIIAHRLSTIHRADQILVIDKGRIVESGTHDDLMLHNGLYAQIHRIQTSGLRRRKQGKEEVAF